MLEVEVIGSSALEEDALTRLVTIALASAGVDDGHVAVQFVDAVRIAVLSFPVDEDGVPAGPRELGDIVICPEHTADLREAIVHGALHLVGMDHETDGGEMLALQAQIVSWER